MRNLLNWLRTPSAAKVLLLGLGIVSLAIGLKAAWGSDSGSLAIIVGGALVALALLDVRELRLRHHESEVHVKIADALEQAVRESPALNEPEPQPEELAELREKLLAIAARAKLDERAEFARRSFEGLRRSKHPPLEQRADLPPHGTFNLFIGDGSEPPHINGHLRWWGDWVIVCRVTNPQGVVARELFYGLFSHQAVTFTFQYPRDFPSGAPAVLPGDYEIVFLRAWDPESDADESANVLSVVKLTITEEMLRRGDRHQRLEPR